MKTTLILAAFGAMTAFGAMAQDAESPFKKAIEIRHGLMLQLASDMGKLGAIAKGEAAYDAAVATRAADNIAAIASVISLDQFPAGSEANPDLESFALPEIWAKPDDFSAKIKGLQDGANMMQMAAAKDGDAVKAAMATLGGVCSACHKAYRQPEN